MATFKRILLLIAYIIITGYLYQLSFDKIINHSSSIRYYSTTIEGSTLKDLILVLIYCLITFFMAVRALRMLKETRWWPLFIILVLDMVVVPASMLLVVVKGLYWKIGAMDVNGLLDPFILIVICSLVNALYFLPYQKIIKRKP
ncbi:hypothetical protein SAMN04488505_11032 [Chitinophaga rupis]|uniref:Uncharacterized protein n=1 Tax=Chitinophaga rupis TaxID=573321 RepID=A0A1H8G4L4_9BACT|nr:hypothetical protein [Chitinophaga rupis]SEN38819.1 hypothetical protein SAMN04488505_11032 [Chitinophaga rupis]